MATHLRTELVLDALNMALGQRRATGVIHHSDSESLGARLFLGDLSSLASVAQDSGAGPPPSFLTRTLIDEMSEGPARRSPRRRRDLRRAWSEAPKKREAKDHEVAVPISATARADNVLLARNRVNSTLARFGRVGWHSPGADRPRFGR